VNVNSFWIEAEDLWIADGARIVWRGRPEGKRPWRLAAMPDGDAIVVLDPDDRPRNVRGARSWPNLIRVRPTGAVVWRADPFESRADFWVDVAFRHGSLVAWTRSCYACEVDPRTGQTLSRVLTR
jgi:hypothetical protein